MVDTQMKSNDWVLREKFVIFDEKKKGGRVPGTLVIMDCQFDIKKECVIGPEDLHMELKDEKIDQRSSIDFRCEAFPTLVSISSQDTELENLETKMKIEDDQISIIDIKCETHPAADLLSFEDTKFE
ncbi:hypothetical protein L9F63_020214, partial [Diploptera punctata]